MKIETSAGDPSTGRIQPGQPWVPLADDELSWFRAGPPLATQPTPLQFTLHTQAFTFAFAHALVSLYCPLFRVRYRLIDGRLYLGVVPSGLAEIDLERQMQRLRASSLRFSRNIPAGWQRGSRQRGIKEEVEASSVLMNAFPPGDASGAQAAEGFVQLRRTRSNQWFDSIRAVFAPTAMLLQSSGGSLPDEVNDVLQEARKLVVDQGGAAFEGAIGRVGQRLASAGAIQAADDVTLLEYAEVRDALDHGGSYQAAVEQRRNAAAQRPRGEGPEWAGPPLPPDAPRMYLVRETLGLLA